MLGPAEVAELLPHGQPMVLIDRVEAWSGEAITCRATSHRNADNPLAGGEGLSILCGVEYAAQAMALHGALNAGEAGRPGVLAGLRELRWSVDRLDRVAGDLLISAELLMAEGRGSIYRFSLAGSDGELMTGQATVVLT